MSNSKEIKGKIAYGVLFLVILPLFLWQWSVFLDRMVVLPEIKSHSTGTILVISGLLLMLWAMYALKRFGKGLPMNAFPPRHFVSQGPYRIFGHPIYIGFSLLMVGFFILIGSAAGLWIVTPITILGIVALVLGYENIDLQKRFPNHKLKMLSALPSNDAHRSTILKKFTALFWVYGTLSISNFIIQKLITSPPEDSTLAWQNEFLTSIPNLLWSGLIFLLLIPFVLKRNKNIREWIIKLVIAISIYSFLILFFPVILKFNILETQRPVYTVTLIVFLISIIRVFKTSALIGFVFLFLALGIIILNSHYYSLSISNILYTTGIVLLAENYFMIWKKAKALAETIANSWKEWIFGKIRIINHGFYVGFGSFLGILFAGILVGDNYAWAILLFAIIVIIFSALWAQIIEGSEKLKRPYGYYGALVGIIFASTGVHLMGFNVWIIIGVISVVMPWVQAVGRLRCLINGCCHGSRVSNNNIGIRYFHYRSRVCGISNLKGELLHPTPLYSIFWLVMVGFVLLSMWLYQYPMSFIFGLYLILTSIGRFAEEAYRGEVQTPIIKGLRLYQWTAIIALTIGIIFTCIPSITFIENNDFGWQSFVSAFIGGMFTFFAMGVDFPYSNVRFSRLV